MNPEAPSGAALLSPAEAPSAEELAAYVGPNADRYLEQWGGILAGTSRLAGFNWSAFLAGAFWLAYRRLYWESAAFIAFLAASDPAEALLVSARDLTPVGASLLVDGVLFAFYLLLGVAANPWYFRKASRAISAERAVRQPDLGVIHELGGVRPAAPWLLLVLVGFAFAVAAMNAAA